MKCPKVSEISDRGRLDMISSLPDELLSYILSFLPTLSAVQTSVLSTRWRYLFTLTTNLSFDDQEYFDGCGKLSSGIITLEDSFRSFVYGVLALHRATSVQKFSLKMRDTCRYDRPHVFVWITSAMLKGVKHLNIDILFRFSTLPKCIFYSQTLVRLEISSMVIHMTLEVPRMVCLPSLRFLNLHSVVFSDEESIIRFFVGCSQLKELILVDCVLGEEHIRVSALALEKLTVEFCRGHVEIDAPNLACLSYMIFSYENTNEDTSLLLKKSCSPSRLEVGFESSELFSHMPHFVISLITGAGAQNARELILRSYSLELLTRVDDSRFPTYRKLENLHLDYCTSITWKYVTFWLAKSPKLKTIVFNEGLLEYSGSGTKHTWEGSMELAPFSSTVETIEVHQFEGTKSEFLLLNYLLENAGLLKRLTLYTSSTMNIEEELHASKKLPMLPKASTNCTIELKKMDR